MAALRRPGDHRPHAGHLWANAEAEGLWRIGGTDAAQRRMNEIIFSGPPSAGAHRRRSGFCADLEPSTAVSAAAAPFSVASLDAAHDADHEQTLDAEAYKALVSS